VEKHEMTRLASMFGGTSTCWGILWNDTMFRSAAPIISVIVNSYKVLSLIIRWQVKMTGWRVLTQSPLWN